MRTKNGSVRELIAGIRQAAEQEEYNPAEDLKTLQTQYKRLGKKDFGLMLDAMVEKYAAGEYAAIHAASRNWANRYAREERKGKRIHHSTYLQAPAAWLGPKFLAQAEYIKETQPTKYRHEYLGEVVGSGTQVFENLRLEPISQKTIRNFDTIENGVDWGWYPDPWAFNRCHYDAARKTLYIFDELTRLRTSNEETAKLVQQRIESWESVTADSAEMKSCADYRAFGILCREAVKGPGSVNQSMKWLQGLADIVIDPHRCPDTAKEFSEYEYEVGRDGTVLPGYVDADNHHIDAVRYAVNRIWMRRGA